MLKQRCAHTGLAMMLAVFASPAVHAENAVAPQADVAPPVLTVFDAGSTFTLNKATPRSRRRTISGVRSIISGPPARPASAFRSS
jgi:hypothetical protein